MRYALTHELIDNMVQKAKKSFFESDRPVREKKLLKEIIPFIYFNEKLKTTWGRAWLCHLYHPDRKIIGIPRDYPSAKVEGRNSRFILEINPDSQYAPVDEVIDTVSHELAHLLDFRLKGYYIRYKEYHHQGWKDIHLAMGGSGESYGPEDINLSRFRNSNHRYK